MNTNILRQIAENNWIPVVYTDIEGKILFTNPAADKLYGYAKDEMTGLHVSILSASPERSYDFIVQNVKDKDGWTGEILRRRKDGSTFPGEVTVWKIFDDKGQLTGHVSNSRDLTEEKERSEKMSSEKERLFAIINNTEDDICSLNDKFELIEFNNVIAEKVRRGYGFELKPGTSIFSILPEGSQEKQRNIYYRVMLGEKVMQEDEFMLVSGEKIYYESFYNPIVTAGKITGIAVFSRNTTERKKREMMLQNTLRERELLLAEVHHRVKNNLAIVSSFLQLEEYNSQSTEVKELLKDSKTRIKTTALVHELLYKNESLTHIDISSYINDLVRLISATYFSPQNNIVINTDVLKVQFSIHRAISVGLVLNELVSNAYKHAFRGKEKGEIFIGLRSDNENCMIVVSDNGNGLPGGFDFETSTQTGTLLVKTFVEQLGGNIEVSANILSDGNKNGTKFILAFALEKDSDS